MAAPHGGIGQQGRNEVGGDARRDYQICFAVNPPYTIAQLIDFVFSVPTIDAFTASLSLSGPYPADYLCTLGLNCVIGLEGVRLRTASGGE